MAEGRIRQWRRILGKAAAALIVSVSTHAIAGGFGLREQSASSLGSAFAGAGAGGDLSAMYWNPAALGMAGPGFESESHYSVILPSVALTATGGTLFAVDPLSGRSSGEIGRSAVIGSSYYSYQIDRTLTFGLSLTAPYGLATEPENPNWIGAPIGRTAKIASLNAAPTVSYVVAPGVTVGAGVQVQYLEGTLKFATGPGFTGAPNAFFNGDDIGVGYTLGVLLQPTAGTVVGLGFRSSVSHELDGTLGNLPGLPARLASGVALETPEVVSLSLRQNLASSLRALGTFEWTNWSRFDRLDVVSGGASVLSLPADWEDGWFMSGGLEFDWSSQTTLRAGLGYEHSPIQTPGQRLLGIPDNDRLWASIGATFRPIDNLTMNLGYAHVFLDDSRFDRAPVTNPVLDLTGEAEASADILSASVKWSWGGAREEAAALK